MLKTGTFEIVVAKQSILVMGILMMTLTTANVSRTGFRYNSASEALKRRKSLVTLESTAHGLTFRSVDEDEGSLPRGRANRQNAGKIERSAEALLMNDFI